MWHPGDVFGTVQGIGRHMNPATICIADDHLLFREGLIALLQRDHRVSVVGEASNGHDALKVLADVQPQALLLDVEMPGPPATTTIASAGRVSPRTRVFVLSMHDDNALRVALCRAGAAEVFSKNMSATDLVTATLQGLAGARRSRDEIASDGHRLLTPREYQVMRLVGLGLSNREIGGELTVSEGTVKRHLSNIFQKLGASSRVDALRRARRLGEATLE